MGHLLEQKVDIRVIQEVSYNIIGVSKAARETGRAAGEILDASGEMARQFDMLKREVERFLNTIRAA